MGQESVQGQGHPQGQDPTTSVWPSLTMCDNASLVCEIPNCGRMFANEEEASKHRILHQQGFYKHVCSFCGKGFSRVTNLEGHVVKHHMKDNAFVCQACGKSYAYKGSLTHHIKTKASCLSHYQTMSLASKDTENPLE